VGGPERASYHAAKHGVIGLTKSAALAYAARGIRINAVCPGLIETAMSDQMKAAGQTETLEAMLKEVPIGRIGRAEEIADVVLWLCGATCCPPESLHSNSEKMRPRSLASCPVRLS
jgi:NAD(P)-dependent dehydrogenase (short-subunit alcohol dehydrogenase family)